MILIMLLLYLIVALKKFYSQELSSRIGEETKFEVLQLEGEIAENVIKNIENAEKYLSESRYEDLQTRKFSNFFFTTVPSPYQKYQLLHRLTPPSVWRVFVIKILSLKLCN
jgi:hypothetical protein